jgi:dynein heavy chain
MTALFLRMTNEMITCCKRNLYGNARGQPPNPALMWQKDPVEIIAAFRGCVDLMNAYKREYTSTKEKLAAMPKGRQFNFDDVVIFARFKIFCKRLEKLIDMFESLQQYNLLKEAEVDGMEELMQNYGTLLIGFQKKNHDLLDYENSVFERDFVEFMMSNSQIESDIQTFIDKSFSAISSIMSALKLLANFRRLLLRPSLSADLDTKFLTIFTQYGAEVQRIEEQYTRECNRPPLARNAPFVTGAISWARQLLDRIYGPMQVFTQHPHVFVPKENKKIVKQFNKLAKVLMQFELVHYQEWCRSVEKIKVALEQPLFVRRKPTGADGEVVGLDINLDASVFTMIKEARNLKLMGFKDLPEAALMVLRLEPRLKQSYDVMRNALIEYQQMQRVSPVLRVLIRAPLADLDLALRPGLTTVSWTSMNVDTFAQTVESSLYRFKMLVNQMTDFVENRLVYNLNQVEQTLLLNLESIQPSSLDNFTAMQEKAMAAQTKVLVAKNVEIERAVDDLISVVNAYPVHATIVRTTTTDLNKVKAHYCAMLYKAVLRCVQNSLEELKKRVTFNKERTFADGALFEVELQLVVPEVRISPTLAQVQTCVNGCVAALLQSSRALLDWGIDSNGVPTERASFYNRLASDKSIVVMMLMMTGSVEQTKTQMAACTAPFTKLSWLWMEDPEKKYKEFAEAIQTETGDVPTLEDFTRKLGEFKAVENEIAGVTTVQTLGCLFIKPETLKEQLKAECNRWKMQFSEKLHKEAKAAMDAVLEKMKLNRTRMQAEIKDLPTLKAVMDVFAELRSMQTWIEMEFNRVFDMYAQLEKSFPPGSGYIGKEEMDNRSILKPTWKTILQEADQYDSINISHLD